MPNYKLSQIAKEDLIRIHQYGIITFGENQADKYFESFFEYFEIISKRPYSFESVDDIKVGYRRCVCGVDSIYFRINEDIVEKMTFLTAIMLEKSAPMMRYKGRIQVGADADITIFNPDTVSDKATFEEGLKFSEGIEYVLVNGVLILEKGKKVDGVFPGQAIYGKYKK